MKQQQGRVLFYSCAPSDDALCEQLARVLHPLVREARLAEWAAYQLPPGTDTLRARKQGWEDATFILLLLSPDYLASDIYYQEMLDALERQQRGEAHVLPILLRPCDRSAPPLATVRCLPNNERAVTSWDNKEQAFFEISQGVRQIVGLPAITLAPHAQVTISAPRTEIIDLSPIFHLPYLRNPYFTGREDILKQLHNTLIASKATALTQRQAISGLGGIGKTQTAVEYAYCYRDEYYDVLWVNAATRDTLIASFRDLARLLSLPEKGEPDQKITVQEAMKRWLEQHDHWLMIVDNADELSLTYDFLPTLSKGHILLTTRAQALGTLAKKIDLEKMEQDEGTLFLLRRAKILPIEAPLSQAQEIDRFAAETIVKEMDGLPLALDQAGSYIEETHCSISDYLKSYLQRQAELLKRRGGTGKEHPEPVATTWSLSFEQVKQLDPMATDLLRVCAFLAPDAIPEELFLEGASQLGARVQPLTTDATRLNDAIGVLLCYSLMERNTQERTVSIHRLVQAALKNSMNKQTRRTWAERTVRAVNLVFPSTDLMLIHLWEACLPHALVCAGLIKDYGFEFNEASHLLNETGVYLFEMHSLDKYAQQVEALLKQAMEIRERQLGLEHPDTLETLHRLADLYSELGKYGQAEKVLIRILTINEKKLGPEHPQLVGRINDLVAIYYAQGEFEKAERILLHALTINERKLGPEHPNTLRSLLRLGELYIHYRKYEQAEKILVHALEIYEQQLGSEHHVMVESLSSLWRFYIDQGKYEQAEKILARLVTINEKKLGLEHPDTVESLSSLWRFYIDQGEYEQAEKVFTRRLAFYVHALKLEQYPDTVDSLSSWTRFYIDQGKYEQAEKVLGGAATLSEYDLGLEHHITMKIFNSLARFYIDQGAYEKAERILIHALASEHELGPEHPEVITIRKDLVALQKKMGRTVDEEE